jgi:hypothetical protein
MGRPALVRLAGILCLLLGAAACGGRTGPGASDPVMPPDRSTGTGGTADREPRTGDDGADAPVTERECEALLAHVIALANEAHVRNVPPEQAPTDEQLVEIRARLAPRFLPACLALDRHAFACEMRAQSTDELLACAQAR